MNASAGDSVSANNSIDAMAALARMNGRFRNTVLEPFALDVGMEAVELLRAGLPWSATHTMAVIAGLTDNALGEALRLRTGQEATNALEEGRLSTEDSNKIARVIRVLQYATMVLDDDDAACRWIGSRVRTLGSVTPMSLLDTLAGYELVMAALARLEAGTCA